MLREEVLSGWKACKEIFSKLKAKSIDNYEIAKKRTILGLENSYYTSPLELRSFSVELGEVIDNPKTGQRSNFVVEVHTEILKVAILERLSEGDDFDIKEVFLRNYEGEIDYSDDETGPTIDEVD